MRLLSSMASATIGASASDPGPAVELPTQVGQLVLGAQDHADLPEVEAEQLLELPDAQQPGDVPGRVAPRAPRLCPLGSSSPSSS